MSPSRHHRPLGALIYDNYLKGTLIPIFAIELVLLLLYFGITLYVSGKNQALLLDEATKGVQEIASREVANINAKLQEVTRLAQLMRRDHEAFFASSQCIYPNGEPRFARHANGAYFKTSDNGGGSLYYSAAVAIDAAQVRKAACSEVLDPLLRSIVETSPVVTQAYINTWDDMNRIFPFMPDAPGQYGPALDIQTFNFYYLADAAHDPSRGPVWTGAYLDPAGQGWMVSLVVPIYSGDFLEGVSGLDVTIASFVDKILDLELPWRAATLMVDEKGDILAMQERARQLLGPGRPRAPRSGGGAATGDGDAVALSISSVGGPSVDASLRDLLRSGARIGTVRIDDTQYLLSQEVVAETGWRVISLIRQDEVLAPITRLKTLSNRIGYIAIAGMLLFYLVFFVYMLRRSREMSQTITAPIAELTELTRDLGRGMRTEAFSSVGIVEIDDLGNNFNAMTEALKQRTQALVDARLSAEAASRAKSIFLANMSHELRTPLNGIIGMSTVAQRHATDPRQLNRLAVVEKSAYRLLELIRDILDVTAMESNRLVFQSERFTLAEVMSAMRKLIGRQAQAKGLRLTVELADGVAAMPLVGDSLRLGQVLNNLASNAVKFSESGEIRVRGRVLDDLGDAVRLRFEVSDQGIGIAPRDQQRLFTDFEQLDGSSTRRFGGAGLGLAICRRLVEAMDGEIGVDSRLGEGATFWFTVRVGKTETPGPTEGRDDDPR